MNPQATQSDQFKEKMQGSLFSETKNSSAIKVAKHNHVYTVGDERETVYFIEKGQSKLVVVSRKARSDNAIHGAGMFSANCACPDLGAAGNSNRNGRFVFERDSLRQVSRSTGYRLAPRGFIKHLAVRIAANSERSSPTW
jgi:hypothetical protein